MSLWRVKSLINSINPWKRSRLLRAPRRLNISSTRTQCSERLRRNSQSGEMLSFNKITHTGATSGINKLTSQGKTAKSISLSLPLAIPHMQHTLISIANIKLLKLFRCFFMMQIEADENSTFPEYQRNVGGEVRRLMLKVPVNV